MPTLDGIDIQECICHTDILGLFSNAHIQFDYITIDLIIVDSLKHIIKCILEIIIDIHLKTLNQTTILYIYIA